MEGLCCQLKDEKDALEVRLLGESETVRFLQNKIRHLESSLNDKVLKTHDPFFTSHFVENPLQFFN